MKIHKKQIIAVIAIVLTFMSTIVLALPVAFGQFQNSRQSMAWASVYPNPVGKGQTVYVVGWIYPMPDGNGKVYYNYTFTVTKPDGNKIIRTMDSSVEATAGFVFAPDQVGSWNVVLSFPGDTISYYVTPSVSPPYQFTVQENPIPTADYSDMPTGRWTYPVSLANQEWFRITGSWPKNYGDGYSSANYFSTGPESAHIIWKKPFMNGGLLGGEQGHEGIVRPDQGGQYPGNIVAAHGRLYYRTDRVRVPTGSGSIAATNVTDQDRVPVIVCLDQYTGEEIWRTDLPTINYTTGLSVAAARNGGSTLQIVELSIAKGVSSKGVSLPGMGNQGEFALWASGGGLWKIDPLTGQIIWYQLEPALSPTYYDGAWYIANYPASGNFTCFTANSDYNNGFPPMADASFGFPQTVNDVIIWTKNMSKTGIPSNPAILEGYLVRLLTNANGESKLDTWNAKTGELVANGTYGGFWASSASNPVYGNGLYSRLGGDGKTYAWSFRTGSIAWVSDADTSQYPWSTFGNYQGSAGLGYVIAASYAPYKYAIDATTGKIVWKQYTGIDNPYNYEYPTHAPATWGLAVLADNKVYWASGEHTPGTPSERGDMLYCNDLKTGELLWRLPYMKGGRQFYGSGIANGMLFYFSQYDGCLYMIGKGETKTTISATQNVIPQGSSVLIEGRVTDISPGTTTLPNFPNGVPAVGDQSQGDWMGYLYTLGTTGPLVNLTKVTGVPVLLQAMKSDGTTIDIGRSTSDANGHYQIAWNPPSADLYTIIATFEGSKSYYTSADQCGLLVGPAATAINVPSANEVASQVVSQLPTPVPVTPVPTAPSASEVASQVLAQIPAADNTMIIAIGVVIAVLVAVNIVISLRKQRK
jgi:hypothetical protein